MHRHSETLSPYLVVVRLSTKDEPLAVRQREHAPLILDILTRINERGAKPNLAFTAGTGETFAFLVRTKLNARAILSQIDSPGTNDPSNSRFHSREGMLTSPLTVHDQVLILELDADYVSHRFPMQKDWLDKAFAPSPADPHNLFEKKAPDPERALAKLDLIREMLNEQEVTDRELLNALLAVVEDAR